MTTGSHWRAIPSTTNVTTTTPAMANIEQSSPGAIPAIPDRDHQHGGVESVGGVSQSIKDAMRKAKNWHALSPGKKESLDMVAHKIGRILSGSDPNDIEHWVDLSGYPLAAIRNNQENQTQAQ